MKRIKIANACFLMDGPFDEFNVGGYTFRSLERAVTTFVYTHDMALRRNRLVKQNAIVEFNRPQADSFIFSGGRVVKLGIAGNKPGYKRKHIEDLLILISILTGFNWALYSRRKFNEYPVTASNHLHHVSRNSAELATDLATILTTVKDASWRQQFNNGFHLVVLFNNANVLNQEARFLAHTAMWELLYSLLFGSESDNLHKVIRKILVNYWPTQTNLNIFHDSKVNGMSKNVFYVIRNQLAHRGTLPIDRTYAEQWMKNLPTEETSLFARQSVYGYMKFFGELTHVVALKTVGLDVEHRLGPLDFTYSLNTFLATGKI